MCLPTHTFMAIVHCSGRNISKNSLEVESHTPKTQIVYLVKKIVSTCDVKFQLYF